MAGRRSWPPVEHREEAAGGMSDAIGARGRRANRWPRKSLERSEARRSIPAGAAEPSRAMDSNLGREAPMRVLVLVAGLVLSLTLVGAKTGTPTAAKPEWSMNATAIEACSCPVFCQCYFNTSPAGHGEHMEGMGHEGHGMDHFCRFNNAYKVNHGYFGATRLDGAKFWIYGDLGGDFTKGMDG